MATNGTAVEGVNVTRRQHRAGSWFFSREMVTVQGGYGTCFCRHGRNFVELDECRGTSLVSGCEVVPVARSLQNGHWCSVAVQICQVGR
jgi:hypothetical protein